MTGCVYIDLAKQVGNKDHIKSLPTVLWFEENDPLGFAFECEVLVLRTILISW
jgi:hypothetical protein